MNISTLDSSAAVGRVNTYSEDFLHNLQRRTPLACHTSLEKVHMRCQGSPAAASTYDASSPLAASFPHHSLFADRLCSSDHTFDELAKAAQAVRKVPVRASYHKEVLGGALKGDPTKPAAHPALRWYSFRLLAMFAVAASLVVAVLTVAPDIVPAEKNETIHVKNSTALT